MPRTDFPHSVATRRIHALPLPLARLGTRRLPVLVIPRLVAHETALRVRVALPGETSLSARAAAGSRGFATLACFAAAASEASARAAGTVSAAAAASRLGACARGRSAAAALRAARAGARAARAAGDLVPFVDDAFRNVGARGVDERQGSQAREGRGLASPTVQSAHRLEQ